MPSLNHSTTPRIIIHGGAGNITRQNLPPASYALYQHALLTLLHETSQLLQTNHSALTAATHAVTQLENNPLFNCGRGAVFTRAGTIELEASIMVSRGYRKRGVGISLIKRVKNPILLAREMLIRGETDGDGGGNGGDGDPSGGAGGAQGHCQISGLVAEELAREWGLEMCEERWHWTRRRWEEHKRGLEGEKGGARTGMGMGEDDLGKGKGEREWVDGDAGWDGKEYLPQGTVGCVCLDRDGVLCVATSTGGLTNKLPGRIGDTPTLGAGFWAEEWKVLSPRLVTQPLSVSPLMALLPASVREALGECFPSAGSYINLAPINDKTGFEREKANDGSIARGVAMSGTGNGDSFLRLAAVRTAGAIARFAPNRSLVSAVSQIAGPGGELQASAEERFGRTGEGEGGIIGIEVVGGRGEVVADFNCGGMFRAWVDEGGVERMRVFRGDY